MLVLALATVFALAFVVAAASAGQAQEPPELPDCPPEFPLCPEEPEEETPEPEPEPGPEDPPPAGDDPQVTETPEGGVATGTGSGVDGSLLPLALIGGAAALAVTGGALARHRASH